MSKIKTENRLDNWIYKNKITIFFNIFSAAFCVFFVILSGLGKYNDFEPKVIKVPDGVIYTPKFQSKNPWVRFYIDGKRYSTSCADFNYGICESFHNQELIGNNVLFLLPDSSTSTTSGLILRGDFLLNNKISFSVFNQKENFLRKEKFFRYIGVSFRYLSYIYFIAVLLLIGRIFYLNHRGY